MIFDMRDVLFYVCICVFILSAVFEFSSVFNMFDDTRKDKGTQFARVIILLVFIVLAGIGMSYTSSLQRF